MFAFRGSRNELGFLNLILNNGSIYAWSGYSTDTSKYSEESGGGPLKNNLP